MSSDEKETKTGDFRFNVLPSPLVCGKCGRAAWFHASSTIPGERAITYCTFCQEATTLREFTKDDERAARERMKEELAKWLNKPIF